MKQKTLRKQKRIYSKSKAKKQFTFIIKIMNVWLKIKLVFWYESSVIMKSWQNYKLYTYTYMDVCICTLCRNIDTPKDNFGFLHYFIGVHKIMLTGWCNYNNDNDDNDNDGNKSRFFVRFISFFLFFLFLYLPLM